MKNFFKENIVLVVGITLPLLLVIAFMLASILPKYFVDGPQYNFAYIIDVYDPDSPREVRVELVDDRVKIKFREFKGSTSSWKHHLFIFDAKTQISQEVPLSFPVATDEENKTWQTLELEEISGLKLETSEHAPDGYVFLDESSSGGLFHLLFYDPNRNGTLISKNGHVIRIAEADRKYDDEIQFLGWIIEK